MMIVPFQSICRLCCSAAESQQKTYSIFDKTLTIKELIKDCLKVKVSERDGLPKSICKPCFNLLNSFHQFRVNTAKNELVIKSLPKNLALVEVGKNEYGITLREATDKKSAKITEETVLPSADVEDEEDSSLEDFEIIHCSPGVHEGDQDSEKGEIEFDPLSKPESPLVMTRVLKKIFDFDVASNSNKKESNKLKELGLQQCKFCQMVFLWTEMPSHLRKMHRDAPKIPRQQAPKKPKLTVTTSDEPPCLDTEQNNCSVILFDNKIVERNFNCDDCKKVFRKKANLEIHIIQVHFKENPFRFVKNMLFIRYIIFLLFSRG